MKEQNEPFSLNIHKISLDFVIVWDLVINFKPTVNEMILYDIRRKERHVWTILRRVTRDGSTEDFPIYPRPLHREVQERLETPNTTHKLTIFTEIVVIWEGIFEEVVTYLDSVLP